MSIPFPGDLLHLDIKGMTRFQQVVWRGDGRRRGQQKHPGWEALHVAVDDHSRMAFTRILPDQKTHTSIAFLKDAVDFFALHGITAPDTGMYLFTYLTFRKSASSVSSAK
jgi:hypothetical protein